MENTLHSSNNLMAAAGLYNENTNEFRWCSNFQMDFVYDVKGCKSLGLLLVFVVSRKGTDINVFPFFSENIAL